MKKTIAMAIFAIAAMAGSSSAQDSFMTDMDGRKYRTVQIGGQVWMAENLNYEVGKSSCYRDCEKCGLLYDWETAKFVCPDGWHLPTKDEWNVLKNSVGDTSLAGVVLKSRTNDWLTGGKGMDKYGFTALPCGRQASSDTYGSISEFWSASDLSYKSQENSAHTTYFTQTSTSMSIGASSKGYRHSVRCVKNREGIGDMLGGLMGGISADDLKAKNTHIKASSEHEINMDSENYRSKQEIMAVVNARMLGLRNIYSKYLKLKPGLNGKVTLRFTVAPNGNVTNINIVSSTTGYAEFDNAAKNMVATWKWKIINNGNTTATIPFNFEVGQ